MFARSTTPSLIVIGTSHIATLAFAAGAESASAASTGANAAASTPRCRRTRVR